MRRHVIEHLLWCAVAAGPVATYVMWNTEPAAETDATSVTMAPLPEPRRLAADGVARLATSLIAADPFRFDRKPSSVPYQPELEGAPPPPPAPPKPPKPTLVLRGMVGGPPWDAMVEGIPGRQGPVLVRRGDTLGGLTIRAIQRDTVIIQGADTTRKLTIKRDW